MRIGWIGNHAEGVPALEAVVNAGHNVVAVVTLEPARAARRSAAVDYPGVAKRLSLPVHFVKHINSESSIQRLQSFELDLLVVLGWSQILNGEALACARIGTVGAHASMLPHNRGSAPVNWAILRGERVGGNTLMWLSEGVDEGSIVAQRPFEITPFDTCHSVYEKVAATNSEMVLWLLDQLQRGERPQRRQPPTTEPLLPRRTPQDGLIDWDRTGTDVYNFVRALTRPYPGAFSHLLGDQVKIWRAALLPAAPVASPHRSPPAGTVLGPIVSPDPGACGQVVACSNGEAIAVLAAQVADRNVLEGRQLAEQRWTGQLFTDAPFRRKLVIPHAA